MLTCRKSFAGGVGSGEDERVSMEGLEPVREMSVGDWIAGRLRGPVGTVGSVVPRDFAAYARVLHPVDGSDDVPVTRWAQVCALTGRIPHALMQWKAIATPAAGSPLATSKSGPSDEVDVWRGSLDPEALGVLLDVLEPFTGGQECFHALWEGWGWDGAGVAVASASTTGEPPPPVPTPRPAIAPEVWHGPRLRLPGRDYLLFSGPLSAALRTGHQLTATWFDPQSPNLLWPRDRSWCLASEIDFDSTLVAGSAPVIEAVLAAPGLEAWRVGEDDDLTAYADVINAAP
jgi:hypothetical protein